MSDFVTECRREWKRLRVPDPLADEMAADLAADLSEAASEGVSAEEVLGVGALDARSFAASWAAERGVIEPSPARKGRTGSLVLAAIGVLCVAAVAAGVAILATPSGTTSALAPPPDGAVWTAVSAGSGTVTISPLPSRLISASLPGGRSEHTDAIAWTLLIAGIAGIVLAALCLWRIGRRAPETEGSAPGYA